MFIEGKVVDLTRKRIEPKNGKNFTPFEQVIVLIKESPERAPQKVVCSSEHLQGIEVGKNARINVYVRMYGGNGKPLGYEIKQAYLSGK